MSAVESVVFANASACQDVVEVPYVVVYLTAIAAVATVEGFDAST